VVPREALASFANLGGDLVRICGLAKPGYINDEAGRRYALCHICYGLGRWEQSQVVARLRVSQAMIQLISTVASIRYIFEIRPMGT
jgi:hypothetical protein